MLLKQRGIRDYTCCRHVVHRGRGGGRKGGWILEHTVTHQRSNDRDMSWIFLLLRLGIHNTGCSMCRKCNDTVVSACVYFIAELAPLPNLGALLRH